MRWSSAILFVGVAAACIDFDSLERDALARLDAGVAAGGSAVGDGGTAGGGTAGGGTAGGGTAGGGTAGGGTAGGGTAGGGTAGGVGAGTAVPPCDGGRCICSCQDGGCLGQCTIEPFAQGTIRSLDIRNLEPLALATTGSVIALVDGARSNALQLFDGGFQGGAPSMGASPFRTLDARHGEVLAVYGGQVIIGAAINSFLTPPVPATVAECFGGAIYTNGSTVQRVAACTLRDGGLGALDVGIELTGNSTVGLPPGFRPSSVQIRPDEGGPTGRYVIGAEDGGALYRFFRQNTFSAGTNRFFASQVIVASSEAEEAVIALKTDQGVRTYRGLQAQPMLDPTGGTQVSNGLADLRSFATFVPDGTTATEVYVLQRTGAPGGLSFRNFAIEDVNDNDWFLVVDRPGLVRAYNLGTGLSRAFVAPYPADDPDAGVLLVARCESDADRGLCRSGVGTYFERLPID